MKLTLLSLELMNFLLKPWAHLPTGQALAQLSAFLTWREAQNRSCRTEVWCCREDHSVPKWDIKLEPIDSAHRALHSACRLSSGCEIFSACPTAKSKPNKKTTPKWLNQFSTSNTKPQVERKTYSSRIPSHQSPQNLYSLLLLCWGWKKKTPQTADVGFVTYSVLEKELWTTKGIWCCANSKTQWRRARNGCPCRVEEGIAPLGHSPGSCPQQEGKEPWDSQRAETWDILGSKWAVVDGRIVWVPPAQGQGQELLTSLGNPQTSFKYEAKAAGKLKDSTGFLGDHGHCNLKALKGKINKQWQLYK